MTTILYYFSGTGNSLALARALAERLGDTEIIPMAKAVANGTVTPDADAVGLVFPVYMWGLPLMVERFANTLSLKGVQYCFAVANYGGFPAATLPQLKKTLAARGITLAAGFGVKMPGNYTPMYGALPVEKQKKFFETAASRVAAIASAVNNRVHGIEKNFPLVNLLFSGIFYRLGAPRIPGMDKDFRVDDTCTSCGQCAQVCPAQNIVMAGGRPVWQHHCEQCMACLQWCPAQAIQAGTKTAGRARYHRPAITVDDIRMG